MADSPPQADRVSCADLAICKCGTPMYLVEVNTAETSMMWRCPKCKRRMGMLWDETRLRPRPGPGGAVA